MGFTRLEAGDNNTPVEHQADPLDPASCRPITGLQELAKKGERPVAGHLQSHMSTYNIWDPAQFGFRAGHWAETALSAVWDDAWETYLPPLINKLAPKSTS